MLATREVLAADEQRFVENLGHDQKEFAETIASLQMLVAGFAQHTDIKRCEHVAVEVRKIHKALKDAQHQAQTYNNRERLCGREVTNYDHLNRTLKEFEPFKNLWLTSDEWLKSHKVPFACRVQPTGGQRRWPRVSLTLRRWAAALPCPLRSG
jgi:dynein heavy chain